MYTADSVVEIHPITLTGYGHDSSFDLSSSTIPPYQPMACSQANSHFRSPSPNLVSPLSQYQIPCGSSVTMASFFIQSSMHLCFLKKNVVLTILMLHMFLFSDVYIIFEELCRKKGDVKFGTKSFSSRGIGGIKFLKSDYPITAA